MAPIPKAPPSVPEPKLYSRTHPATPEDDIVIGGVSGSFPNSRNVEEFAYNLYNKVCDSMRTRTFSDRNENGSICLST